MFKEESIVPLNFTPNQQPSPRHRTQAKLQFKSNYTPTLISLLFYTDLASSLRAFSEELLLESSLLVSVKDHKGLPALLGVFMEVIQG